MPQPSPIRTERRASVLIVTIARPELRNCVDRPTADALAAAFREFEADDSLRVAVLTGEGEHFCAGADLKAVAGDDADLHNRPSLIAGKLREKLLQLRNEYRNIFIAYAEHNGSYTAAFKNVFDWVSRIDQKVYQGKPMLLLASSPGPGGAASVLAAATQSAPYFAGEVKASLSIASFYDNFDMEQGQISNAALNDQLLSALSALK